jgi:hypothetical protein
MNNKYLNKEEIKLLFKLPNEKTFKLNDLNNLFSINLFDCYDENCNLDWKLIKNFYCYSHNITKTNLIIHSDCLNQLKEEFNEEVIELILLPKLNEKLEIVFEIKKYNKPWSHIDYDNDDRDDYYDSNNWLADAAGSNDPDDMNTTYWNLD